MLVGVVMVALGIALAILAFWQLKRVEKQINSNTYESSSTLSLLLTIVILVNGVLLIFYLLPNI